MAKVAHTRDSSTFDKDAPIEIVVSEHTELVYEIDEHRDIHARQEFYHYRFICKRNSNLKLNIVLTGVSSARYTFEIKLEEQRAHATVFGAVALGGAANQTIKLLQEHQAPHTTSSSLFLSALTDQAALHVTGKIEILKHAVGAEAALYAKNLLLSNTARVIALPSLEVQNNQVRCKHGTATSRCDQGQLLYSMSRGIDPYKAHELLLSGFFSQGNTMKQDQMARIMQQCLHAYIP